MLKFRIKINLERFFRDERKYSYIFLNPEWKLIRNVEQHVEKLFFLKDIHFMTEDECYLPAFESIEVINKGEILRVIGGLQSFDSKCAETNVSQSEKQNIVNLDNKSNYTEENQIPKLTREIYAQFDSTQLSVCLGQQFDQNLTEKVGKKRRKLEESEKITRDTSLKIVHKNCDLPTQGLIQSSSFEENVHISKSNLTQTYINNNKNKLFVKSKSGLKKTRTYKCKNKLDEFNGELNEEVCKGNKIDICSPVQKSKSHMRFDSNGIIIENNEKEKGKKSNNIQQSEKKLNVCFKSYLENLTRPRIVKAIELTDQKSSRVESCMFDGISRTHLSNFNIDNYLLFSKPLKTAPGNGDILIFKIYRLSSEYGRRLSKYLCGKVEEIVKSTQFIKIFVIEGHDQLKSDEGKFFMATNTEEDGYIYLKFEDMIDVFKFE